MKKSLISIVGILLTLMVFGVQAGGSRGGGMGGGPRGGGPRGGGQYMQQQQGGSGEMIRKRERIHQQQPGQYQQGDRVQRRDMKRERIHQTAPAGRLNAQ